MLEGFRGGVRQQSDDPIIRAYNLLLDLDKPLEKHIDLTQADTMQCSVCVSVCIYIYIHTAELVLL